MGQLVERVHVVERHVRVEAMECPPNLRRQARLARPSFSPSPPASGPAHARAGRRRRGVGRRGASGVRWHDAHDGEHLTHRPLPGRTSRIRRPTGGAPPVKAAANASFTIAVPGSVRLSVLPASERAASRSRSTHLRYPRCRPQDLRPPRPAVPRRSAVRCLRPRTAVCSTRSPMPTPGTAASLSSSADANCWRTSESA